MKKQLINVVIKDGGMRDGCIAELRERHSPEEFWVVFKDGRKSIYAEKDFEVV